MPAPVATARGHRAPSPETGAVSIEWTGLLVVASLIVSFIVASVASPQFSRAVSAAICRVITLGQGSCEAPPLSADRAPTEPCSVAGNGFGVSGRVGAFNVAGSGEKAIVHEELSNGQHRVVVTSASGLGVETGAGWEARVRLSGDTFGDFSDTTWGWDMGADADAMARGGRVETYLANSTEEANRIVEAAAMDAAIELTTSAGGPLNIVNETVIKPLIDRTREALGMATTSNPTSVTYSAGISAQASAWMTPLGISNVEGTLGGQAMLGVTMHADGTYTIHGEAASITAVTGNFVTLTGSWPPLGAVRIDATYDGDTLTSVSVGNQVSTSGVREHQTWTLPIESPEDEAIAIGLLSPMPQTWDAFFRRVDEHGQATRVSYDTSQTTSVQAAASGRLLTGAGVDLGGSLFDEELISAEYFDGSRWVTWDSCVG